MTVAIENTARRVATTITVGRAELDDLHALAADLSAGQPQTLTMRQALRWLLDNRPNLPGRATAIEGI